MLYLALIILTGGLALLWIAARKQKTIGLPGGRIIYADTRAWGPVEEPLYDASLGLVGRPDYLVQAGNAYIPVEVKSARVSDAPYDSHIYQLAAYCLLVESEYGVRPPYGILHYPNRTFAIDYTIELESALLDVIEDMRTLEHRKEIHRSHEVTARCHGCGYRDTCEEKLAS